MFAKVSWFCFVVAAVCLGCAALWLFVAGEDRDVGNGLIVEELQRDLGEQSVGSHPLEVRVRNTGSKPLRILGIPHG